MRLGTLVRLLRKRRSVPEARRGYATASHHPRHAVRPTLRRPSLVEVFTGCYAAFFGTAAALDVHNKDLRRRQFEAQIADAKEALRILESENTMLIDTLRQNQPPTQDIHSTASYSNTSSPETYTVADTLERIEVKDPPGVTPADGLSQLWQYYGSDYWRTYQHMYHRQTLHNIKRTNFKRIRYWLQRDDSESVDNAHIFSAEALRVAQEEAQNFVCQLLVYVDEKRQSDPDFVVTQQLVDIRTRLDELLHQQKPRYLQPPSLQDFQANNDSLRKYTAICLEKNEDTPMEYICYNLLVTRYPPSARYYNNLLLSLHEARHHHVAMLLVNTIQSQYAFSQTMHYQSAICKLVHLRTLMKRRDIHQFLEQVVYNAANDPSPILTALLTNVKAEEDQGTTDYNEPSRYAAEIIVRTFTALHKMERGVSFFCDSLQRGYLINHWAVVQLLSLCIYTLDTAAASMLVQFFTSHPELLKTLLQRHDSVTSVIAHQLRHIGTICQSSWLGKIGTSRTRYGTRLVKRKPADLREAAFVELIDKHLLEKQVEESESATRKLTDYIQSIHPKFSTSPSPDVASEIVPLQENNPAPTPLISSLVPNPLSIPSEDNLHVAASTKDTAQKTETSVLEAAALTNNHEKIRRLVDAFTHFHAYGSPVTWYGGKLNCRNPDSKLHVDWSHREMLQARRTLRIVNVAKQLQDLDLVIEWFWEQTSLLGFKKPPTRPTISLLPIPPSVSSPSTSLGTSSSSPTLSTTLTSPSQSSSLSISVAVGARPPLKKSSKRKRKKGKATRP